MRESSSWESCLSYSRNLFAFKFLLLHSWASPDLDPFQMKRSARAWDSASMKTHIVSKIRLQWRMQSQEGLSQQRQQDIKDMNQKEGWTSSSVTSFVMLLPLLEEKHRYNNMMDRKERELFIHRLLFLFVSVSPRMPVSSTTCQALLHVFRRIKSPLNQWRRVSPLLLFPSFHLWSPASLFLH